MRTRSSDPFVGRADGLATIEAAVAGRVAGSRVARAGRGRGGDRQDPAGRRGAPVARRRPARAVGVVLGGRRRPAVLALDRGAEAADRRAWRCRRRSSPCCPASHRRARRGRRRSRTRSASGPSTSSPTSSTTSGGAVRSPSCSTICTGRTRARSSCCGPWPAGRAPRTSPSSATYRDTDVEPEHPLHGLLGELARAGPRVVLTGLGPDEVAQLLGASNARASMPTWPPRSRSGPAATRSSSARSAAPGPASTTFRQRCATCCCTGSTACPRRPAASSRCRRCWVTSTPTSSPPCWTRSRSPCSTRSTSSSTGACSCATRPACRRSPMRSCARRRWPRCPPAAWSSSTAGPPTPSKRGPVRPRSTPSPTTGCSPRPSTRSPRCGGRRRPGERLGASSPTSRRCAGSSEPSRSSPPATREAGRAARRAGRRRRRAPRRVWTRGRAAAAAAADIARRIGDVELLARAAIAFGGPFLGILTSGFAEPEPVALADEALLALSPEPSPLRVRLLARVATGLGYTPEHGRALESAEPGPRRRPGGGRRRRAGRGAHRGDVDLEPRRRPGGGAAARRVRGDQSSPSLA